MWNTKELSQQYAALTGVFFTFAFDLEFSRSNCISGMGGPIVMERKGWQSIGCPDVKKQPLCDLEAEETVRDWDDLRCQRFRRLILIWYKNWPICFQENLLY